MEIRGENLAFQQVIGIGGNILKGIVAGDLASLVSGIKQIFAPSTEDFHKKLPKEDHEAMKVSEDLYNSIHLLFQVSGIKIC